MMRRRLVVLPVAGALLAAGCVPGREPAPAAPGGEGAAGAPGGKPVRGGTLTVAMPRDAISFDPVRANDAYSGCVMATVLDCLYELDKDGKVVGRLVEKTENPQPNVYVMTVRKGVTFHDGTALDAEAVRFNLQRHLDTPASPRRQDVQAITSMEVTDPYTLRLTLRTAYVPFLSKFVSGAGYMVSPAAVERLGEALQRDLTGAGSGPFRFGQWQKDTQVVVERNPTYWKKDAAGDALPYLDRIVFKPYPDENVRLTNLRTGDADALIGNPPYKDVPSLRGDSTLTVREIPGLGFSLILLNTQAEPFATPPARRAFSYAFDREQLQKTVFWGNGRALDSAVPETIPWATERERRPYLKRDVARARAELQAAGKAGGFRFTMQVPNNQPEALQIAELIKDQVKEAGLELEIAPLDFGAVLANGGAGSFQALALGLTGDVDPDGILYGLATTGGGQNFPRYSNPDVDRLLEEARSTFETDRRGELYRQAQRILLDEQPFLVYYNPPQITATRRGVQNYPQSYNGYWGTRDLERVWKTA
jgi:peptide/nickel transport system substrate-binding protein